MRSIKMEQTFSRKVLTGHGELALYRAIRKEFGAINELAFQALILAAKIGARVYFGDCSKNDEYAYLRALDAVHRYLKGEVAGAKGAAGGESEAEREEREFMEGITE